MPRWLQIALTLVLFTAAMAADGQEAIAQEDGLYRCTARERRFLDDDGSLVQQAEGARSRADLGSWLVDTGTGAVRLGSHLDQWRVIQRATPASDFVAAAGRRDVDAVTDFIRIRAWRPGRPVTFIKVGLTVIYTGTCEAVQ